MASALVKPYVKPIEEAEAIARSGSTNINVHYDGTVNIKVSPAGSIIVTVAKNQPELFNALSELARERSRGGVDTSTLDYDSPAITYTPK